MWRAIYLFFVSEIFNSSMISQIKRLIFEKNNSQYKYFLYIDRLKNKNNQIQNSNNKIFEPLTSYNRSIINTTHTHFNTMPTTPFIKYRITSITSESPNYPASNLTDQSTTLGWQSEFSPSYPQQLNLQFFTPIRTKTMRLTFHQYKIPSCVEVFVRLTKRENFRKLGYVIPNDNTQSSFEHKEIKTLYFQFPCNYVKLVFYQNYKNQMNLFEQVGLQQITVEGEPLTYNELRNLDFTQISSEEDSENEVAQKGGQQFRKKDEKGQNRQISTLPLMIQTQSMDDMNKQFQEVYQYLEEQKSEAVENQDFKLAANLKNVIQTFKQTQQDIVDLEIQKQQALAEEDFDKCHQIKEMIQKKKEEFQFRVEEMKENEDMFVAEYSHSRIVNDYNESTDRKKGDYQQQRQPYGTQAKTDIKNYFSSTPERQPLSNANQSNKNVPNRSLERELNTKPAQNKSSVNHDEQILPAVMNKMMGKKPQGEDQYRQETGRSQYEEANRNRSQLGGKKTMPPNKKPTSNSPQPTKNRSQSPPKSPRHHHHPYTPTNQNISIRSPILTYDQLPQTSAQKRPQSPNQQPYELQQHHQSHLTQLREQFKHLELDELDVKLRLKLQSHFDRIEEPYWQMIMGKSWVAKKIALTYVLENVAIEDKQTYMATMEFISFSIGDPHPQVILLSLNILRKLIEQGNSNNVQFTLPHLPYFIETIVSSLLNLINSTNKQLSQQAYNLYLLMGMISFLTPQYFVQKLIKHKQTTKVSPQYTAMKIGLMISLIQKYQQTTKSYREVLLWAIEFLKDPNNKVRSEASYVLLILIDIIGEDKVIAVIKDKPELLELFNVMLNSSQLGQGASRVENLSGLGENNSSYVNNDRSNRSKVEDNPSLVLGNKSLSKESKEKVQSQQRNNPHNPKSQLPPPNNNKSSVSTASNRLKNPWTSNPTDPSSQQSPHHPSNRRSSSRSKLSQQHFDDQELQYSKQSDFYGSSIKRDTPSQMYVNRGYGGSEIEERSRGERREGDSEGEIGELEDEEEEEKVGRYREENEEGQEDYEEGQEGDNTTCDYCFMNMQGMDQREHLLRQCKVLVSCQECMGRIYLRQITDHLLRDCQNRTHHQQCRKCGLVFNITQINEHVGQGLCRLQRGEGWERCQFCGQDVMDSDMKWVEHAFKCPNLPEPPLTEPTEKASERGEDD